MSNMLRSHYIPSGIFVRFAKIWNLSIHFCKFILYKRHEIPSIVSRDVPHWQTDVPRDGRTVTHNKYNNRYMHVVFDSN